MTRAGLVLAVALLAGCEEQAEVNQRVTLGTLLTGEESTISPAQEEMGRTIVMVARGWSDWPRPDILVETGIEVQQ